eukprot:Cvel_15068.t2-p1 / transcript=Cvel_15068.t2 / gene=Cvel_15068 / organism=Chromera_velia_CCMP2878 / gene_product=hypothetical protein / transcript_product=hypothetical protein / location=Cvel_scaffold1098:32579-32797(-) / protein_length=73 / sequence_SO=supercontig / SO=protein_coding / is_pseudo=false
MLVSPIEMFEGAVRLRSLWAAVSLTAASDPAGAVGLSAEDRTRQDGLQQEPEGRKGDYEPHGHPRLSGACRTG